MLGAILTISASMLEIAFSSSSPYSSPPFYPAEEKRGEGVS